MELPREYNAAVDLIGRNLAAGRGAKVAYIDDTGPCTYAQLAETLEVALFEQRGRRLHLTGAGQELRATCVELMHCLARAEEKLATWRQPK